MPAMGSGGADPGDESNLKIKSEVLRSGFNYLIFCCFQVFLPLLLTCYNYAYAANSQHIWAVNRIYWSHILGADHSCFGELCVALWA